MPPLVAVLLLLLLHTGDSSPEPAPTYERRDPLTRRILTCEMCPPGTHMAAHCTANTRTKCVPCAAELFTELWNYLPRCIYCNSMCYENQEVELGCSAKNNLVCRCKPGFFSTDDFCSRHSECAPGLGVKTNGTSRTDTVCEPCAEGFYSDSYSKLRKCARHQECAPGDAVILNGSAHHDAVCGTCQDFAAAGEAYRRVLSGVFSTQRIRTSQMKKFIFRFVYKRSVSKNSLPRTKGPLLELIQVWLAEAPRNELTKLPERLKEAQLCLISEKLDLVLSEIKQQNPDCTLVV